MMTNLSTISVKQLKRAVTLRERIERLQNELSEILGSDAPSVSAPGGRRTMSAAARARISAAQKARWAKQKNGAGASPKGRRTMSPAARAKIAAAARARWAKAKAENRNSLAAV